MSLAMIVALVRFRSIYLPMGVFAILLGSFLVHIRVQPYKHTVDNNLESLVLVVALLRHMLSMRKYKGCYNDWKSALVRNIHERAVRTIIRHTNAVLSELRVLSKTTVRSVLCAQSCIVLTRNQSLLCIFPFSIGKRHPREQQPLLTKAQVHILLVLPHLDIQHRVSVF